MSEVYRNAKGQTEEEFLATYKPGDYERPSNTVDMLLFTIGSKDSPDIRTDATKHLKVLLIKRKDHPFIHQWALPGGFVNIDEDIETAAKRELLEETGLSNVYMEQLYTFGDVDRDPRMRVVSVAHMALVSPDNLKPIAGDDAEEVAWFTVEKKKAENGEETISLFSEELGLHAVYKVFTAYDKNGVVMVPRVFISLDREKSNTEIAFDHIKEINIGIERLRNKIEYTPVAFNLVPEKFTLNEIQQVYEVILGRSLTKQNFRVWISKFVEATRETRIGVGHRPATIYRYIAKSASTFDEM